MANSNKRIIAEVGKLQAMATSGDPAGKFYLDKSPVDTPNSNLIIGRIAPQSNIYNQASFQIELKLPAEYPFKAPDVRLLTPIYHPNVSEDGKICIELLNSAEAFKPTTTLAEVVKAVIERIDNPNIDHALKPEIGAEYLHNRSTFDRKAQEMVKKHGLPKP